MSKLIILTAGGSFGHLAPALSLADELHVRGYEVRLITDSRGAKFKDKFGDIPYDVVQAKAIAGNPIKKLYGACQLAFGTAQSLNVLLKHKPDVIVGFGGFPSIPPMWAALLKNTLSSKNNRIILNVHEQNDAAGLANKIMAPHVDKIAYSTSNLTGIRPKFAQRTVFTGNPVATKIAKLAEKPYPALDENGALNILVMGGSLGAESLGRAIPAALAGLSPEHQKRVNILQHCKSGQPEFDEQRKKIEALYAQTAINFELRDYIHDVAAELENTHLYIGRSGAGTVTEMTTAGRPAIYIPYPYHADQQQKLNAEIICDAGGAWLAEEDVKVDTDTVLIENIRAHIANALNNPATLTQAAAKTRAFADEKGYAKSASNLADLIEQQVGPTL
jgi:UDP-N-acetylglucosamine--N-acetylmuramyl-(pentapeptide) pyrophosphoryl-undecaprenol N-acetylglucosamine transferase